MNDYTIFSEFEDTHLGFQSGAGMDLNFHWFDGIDSDTAPGPSWVILLLSDASSCINSHHLIEHWHWQRIHFELGGTFLAELWDPWPGRKWVSTACRPPATVLFRSPLSGPGDDGGITK